MFKLITIVALIYLFYRVTFKPKQIENSETPPNIIDSEPPKKKDIDDDDYIDYEEVK